MPRHPSCALSSLTTKNKLFLSLLKVALIFYFYGFLFDFFFNCQTTPRNHPGFYLRLWWAYLDLNQRPRPYQGRALTN